MGYSVLLLACGLASFICVACTETQLVGTTEEDAGAPYDVDAGTEPSFTSLVCGGACSWPGRCTNDEGHLVVIEEPCRVRGEEGLALLREYRTIIVKRDFDVVVDAPGGAVSFDSLLEVGGRIRLASTGSATAFSFPNLSAIGVNLRVGGPPGASRLDFPQLRSVGSGILVGGGADLVELSFPALESLGTSISIQGNTGLEHIDFPVLETALSRDLEINDNLSLRSVNINRLSRVDGNCSFMRNNPAAFCDVLPWLARTEGCDPPFGETSPPDCN